MRIRAKLSQNLLAAILVLLLVSPTAAIANEKSQFGTCSQGNQFEFSVDWESRKVDFDFDIERANPRESWNIRISRENAVLVRKRLFGDEDGDLSRGFVRRGQLKVGEIWTFVARSESGNTCRATLRF